MEVRNILVAASVPKMANIVIDRVIWVKFILDYGLIFYFFARAPIDDAYVSLDSMLKSYLYLRLREYLLPRPRFLLLPARRRRDLPPRFLRLHVPNFFIHL